MGFLQDAVQVFKKSTLVFVESRQEAEDVYTFRFEKEGDLTWKAGQYGLFRITHAKIKNDTRPLSLASAPAENAVQITTRIGDRPSDFKKAMLALNRGMTMSMSGPLGSFYLKDNRPALLIAGGIGITPFRSMLKQREAEGSAAGQQLNLLYLDSKRSHLYKNELDALADNPSIRIEYLDSNHDLQQEMDKFAAMHKNDGSYYMAGPKAMVDSAAAYLLNRDIAKRNLKKDIFAGY